MAVVEAPPVLTTSVFEMGSFSIKSFTVEKSNASSPPKPLLIVTPTTQGKYPLLQFHHGFCCLNSFYSQILEHISSYGFIVVAPQCYTCCFVSETQEIKYAAAVTNWLSTGLQSLLPNNVEPFLSKLAIAGHSRGGKTSFCLALGHGKPTLEYSVVIGIDPVSGICIQSRPEPQILNYIPRSFDLSIPVCVIGTGLGREKKNCVSPPCAPDGVNHAEFFSESKPPSCYFLAKEFGHMDMLDDNIAALGSCLCKSGNGSKDSMRKGVAGIVVAFLKAYLEKHDGDLLAIVNNPGIAPIKLDPVIYLPA